MSTRLCACFLQYLTLIRGVSQIIKFAFSHLNSEYMLPLKPGARTTNIISVRCEGGTARVQITPSCRPITYLSPILSQGSSFHLNISLVTTPSIYASTI